VSAAGQPRAHGSGQVAGVVGDSLFAVTSELGRDLAAADWVSTPLGPESSWPSSLRNIVRLMLGSRFSMWMAWGPELTFLCNDAYRASTLGAKYPWALGKPAAQVWSEIWPDIGPRIDSVISTGVATWDEMLLLFLERNGYLEETYHTFSYSPISDDSGTNAGMLCVVSEETARVIGERRMSAVRDLGTALAAASTQSDVAVAAGHELGMAGRDLPFALGYLFNARERTAELAWSAGVPAGHPIAPRLISVADTDAPWPADVLMSGQSLTVEDLPTLFRAVPSGGWSDPPVTALLVPFVQAGDAQPLGFLVAGLNRYRVLDADYRGFIELVAGQVAAATLRGRVLDAERQRAEDLAELDRAKTTFFTNVSHELRTPLTLLLGPAADALGDRDHPLPAPQRERVEVVARNADRLLKLVNTLLDFSRLEAGSTQPRFEPVDLARYTSELAAMFDSAIARAGLSYTVNCPSPSAAVYIDREMWAKIVLNLLSNALKATFTGAISVAIKEHHHAVSLSVTDTGVGIPQAEQRRLFERFHRVTGAALRSHEGSGIGLALVAELAQLHGGTVTVESTPGIGSTFIVEIPTGTAHLAADQLIAPTSNPSLSAAIGAGYLAEANHWLSATDTAAASQVPSDRPRVLVVDDNPDMRGYIRDLLRGEYVVETAVDGEDALEQARRNAPDLVLTDVMMPRLDGFGLLAQLRADPRTVHVPVVMLSARAGDDAIVEGLEAGADDYLVKPFSGRELLARVRANLELDKVRRIADELAGSRALLDQAEELAHVGSWEIDLSDMSVTASAEYYRLLGVPPEAIATGGLELAMQSVAEGDRVALAAALDRVRDGQEQLDIELRLNHPSEGQRMVRARGTLYRDANGAAAFIRGSALDITEQREAERAIAASVAIREAASREHAIAEELQRSLLPATAVRAPGLDIAAYYASGVKETQAGGDWYDVIELPDRRIALVIGDVMGRGVRAAAVMGQLRASVRAYARLDLNPGELLRLLDQAVAEMSESTIVTCVYAVYDPQARTLTYANAGHVPPLVTSPGARTATLTAGDPPLGTGLYGGQVSSIHFPAGSRLVLYTDGLVERRESDIDLGIDALIALLDTSTHPIEALPGAAVAALLHHGDPDDDVAIVAVVSRPDDIDPFTMAVEPTRASVYAVRHAVNETLTRWNIDNDTISNAVLVASELVTNAILHGSPPIQLHLRLDEAGIVTEVSDGAHNRPLARELDPASIDGRGLHLIDAVSTDTGTRPIGAGKAIWCVVRR
jgi:signal transduction histidine kinase/serine phosphatase RsbU (regulator of sigma subunit)/DNA-binding response OmpR family regulator